MSDTSSRVLNLIISSISALNKSKRPIGYITSGGYTKTSKGWRKVKSKTKVALVKARKDK